ncbi:MFS transporter [Amycolatopsis thermophila]|uniref:MFS family permease n=1 Tax=Amycolatopsis thermophila TaxID=206084 RepID=A0ABU0EN03_9PSEU|nr:MFS transporter [Amycolatopsis thermophila]MDQ0376665.1 MFS family permease [Amycolatopsis thermophila]
MIVVSDRVAVFVVFALNGAVYGSWAPRVPALAEQVGASPGALGLALLGGTAGLLLAAPLSGRLSERFGARAVVLAATLLSCVVLPLAGLVGSVAWLAAALFGIGFANGALDVAMNIGGVSVERRTGKAIMPVFHAGFSFGGLIASAAAGLAAAQHWSPTRHFVVAAVVTALAMVAVYRGLPRAVPRSGQPVRKTRTARRPVLWLLAVVPLCSAVAEGASSDWSALLLVTEHGAGQGAAALAFTAFSLAMAVTRLGSAWMQRRLGATRTLVIGAVVAGTGLLMSAVVPVAGVAFAGFVLAGMGLAAAFPVALSLAGEAGERADGSGGEREIAFVTTVAYTGFLAGPPLIGGIAQATSLSASFVLVAVLAALIAPAAVGASRARHRERTAAELPV